ncbi:hypothetical protein FP2506_15979 [Fulvimarina pelagi HTCC2506]|uniref:Uncharacterized protein n=1 Tax=Fulvimarina pelagi HTCC2506 TaxID=314231 RepID=Q0G384_9HYPH|nr:hypothetical protein FP2506_15979 [Fulvimarina pelagi HTCC2506]
MPLAEVEGRILNELLVWGMLMLQVLMAAFIGSGHA